MSILERHPAPWKIRGGRVVDVRDDGVGTIYLDHVVYELPTWMDDGVMNLLLAAPDLLAVLSDLVESNRPDHVRAAQAHVLGVSRGTL